MTQLSGIPDAPRLWAIRVQDAAFDDWEGFTAWLESDAAHLAAYEAALKEADWAAELYRQAPRAGPASFIPPPAAKPPYPRRRWYAAGGAIAAAIVAFATFTIIGADRGQEIVTAPGEHRTVPLADGSRIILNGGTRITIDPDVPREVTLASGEALFDVRHDERHPFLVTVGETRLLDAGTVFNVVSDEGALDVAVAEGAVIYQPGAGEIRLAAGDALSRKGNVAQPVLRKASAGAIGGWRLRQLEYNNAPLDQIARDLARNLGQPVRSSAGADRLRYTGTLAIGGKPEDVLRRTGPLLGVDFTADGANGWRMTPADGAASF